MRSKFVCGQNSYAVTVDLSFKKGEKEKEGNKKRKIKKEK
tara:strand:- start:67 stop:186 length:120 start_codon:yes stop_codon:yes gene_type:complete